MKRALLAVGLGLTLLFAITLWQRVGLPVHVAPGYPEMTLDEFITALDEGDWEALSALCASERCARAPEELGSLESAELLRLKPSKEQELWAAYEPREDLHAVRILRAEVALNFSDGPKGPQTLDYVIVQKEPGGPWLIEDWFMQ